MISLSMIHQSKESKHTRGPFSVVLTSWNLKIDSFESSRGALHDPHHQKGQEEPEDEKNPAAVERRPRGPSGGGAPRFSHAPPLLSLHCSTTKGTTISGFSTFSARPLNGGGHTVWRLFGVVRDFEKFKANLGNHETSKI